MLIGFGMGRPLLEELKSIFGFLHNKEMRHIAQNRGFLDLISINKVERFLLYKRVLAKAL